MEQVTPLQSDLLSPGPEWLDMQTGLTVRHGRWWSARFGDNISRMAVGDSPEEAIGKWYFNYGNCE